MIRELLEAAGGGQFTSHFLRTEWEQVVDAWQLETWEAYRDVVRLGRKTRLTGKAATVLWSIFEGVRAGLKATRAGHAVGSVQPACIQTCGNAHPPFDSPSSMRPRTSVSLNFDFLPRSARGGANALFFAGDLGQRIFQQPFSWKSLGVDVRGRSSDSANQLPDIASDQDAGRSSARPGGLRCGRQHGKSKWHGFRIQRPGAGGPRGGTSAAEINAVSDWLTARSREGFLPHEIGIFVRSAAQLDRARAAVEVQRSLTECSTTPSRRSVARLRFARCILPSAWNSGRWLLWPATMKSFRCKSASRQSRMTRISKKCMTRSAICFMSLAPGPGTICWSRASPRRPNS